jgi:hypothetical protein
VSKLFSGALRGEPSGVTDGGPWCGPTMEEWLVRISAPCTPVGETVPWIKFGERIQALRRALSWLPPEQTK